MRNDASEDLSPSPPLTWMLEISGSNPQSAVMVPLGIEIALSRAARISAGSAEFAPSRKAQSVAAMPPKRNDQGRPGEVHNLGRWPKTCATSF